MQTPLVSVIITSYNQQDFIEATIKSVLAQSYPNIEIIIIDDASTDESKEIIEKICSRSRNRKKQMVFKEKNEGVTFSRNIGLSIIQGKYVCFLDGDDLYLPEKIKTQVEFMESQKDLSVSYHDANVFDTETGENLFYYSSRFGKGDGTVHDLISKGMYCHFGSLMFRKESITPYGFYTEISIVDDWLFTVDVLMSGNQSFAYIDEVFTKYRRHSSNITLNWGEKIHQNLQALSIMESRYETFKRSIRVRRSELYFIFIIFNLMKKNFGDALKSGQSYLRYSFPNPFRFMRILFRESKFFLANDFQIDPLTQSLFQAE